MVVAIVVMLLAMLLPTLSRARDAARLSRCLIELRNDGMYKTQIGVDTRYLIPVAEDPANAMSRHGRTFFVTQTSPAGMWPYFNAMDQWAGITPIKGRKQRKSVCPAFENGHLKPDAIGYYASYMWTMGAPHVDYGYPPNYRVLPRRYERVLPKAILSVDGPAYPNSTNYNYYFYPVPNFVGVGYLDMPYRHLGKANFLIHDGSVMSWKREDVPADRFKLIP